MSKIKNDGLDQYGAEPFKSSNLEQLTLKGLRSRIRAFDQYIGPHHLCYDYQTPNVTTHRLPWLPTCRRFKSVCRVCVCVLVFFLSLVYSMCAVLLHFISLILFFDSASARTIKID